MQVYDVPVVFFDLDDTLINKDANSLWIRWRMKHEKWGLVEALLALISLYKAYKKGKVTHWRLSNYYRTRTQGMTLGEYKAQVDRFFTEQGNFHIFPQAASLLFAYQRQGTRVVMITGADDVTAKRFGQEMGIEDVISNRLKIVEDKIAGLEKPLCYGKGKVALAESFVKEMGLSMKDAAFYSDSHSDLPLLEQVGQPVVLNPNAELRQIAKDRAWPALDWRAS